MGRGLQKYVLFISILVYRGKNMEENYREAKIMSNLCEFIYLDVDIFVCQFFSHVGS